MVQHTNQRRALLIIVAILFVSGTIFFTWYAVRRNHWPESITRRLAQLRAEGVPVTLTECDRRYRALGGTPDAVKHFEQAFAALSKDQPPLMPARGMPERKAKLELPRFSQVMRPDKQALVLSSLQDNSAALRLLHEGSAYDRCLFPMDLTNGLQTLLPHLMPCQKAAHLLVLEGLNHARNGDASKATQSFLAALHLAEILRDEPTVVGLAARDRIVATVCSGLCECLDLIPLRNRDLALIAERMDVVTSDVAAIRTAIQFERCMFLSVFQGSNQQIADFMDQGKGRRIVCLGVEFIRAKGILQRDAAFFLKNLDMVEAAATNVSTRAAITVLAAVQANVEHNEQFVNTDKEQINLISCMVLPGLFKAVQADIWVRTLAQATSTAMAIERFRKDTNHLPADLQSLIPQYLTKSPHDPYTDGALAFRLLPKGYRLYSPGPSSKEAPKAAPGSDSDEMVVEIDR